MARVTNEWKEDFQIRLEMAIEENGFSDAELAELIGTIPNAVNHWRTGRNAPTAQTLCGLCVALGVSADWLLGLSQRGGTRRWGGRAERYREEVDERQRAELEEDLPPIEQEKPKALQKDRAAACLGTEEAPGRLAGHEKLREMAKMQEMRHKSYGQIQAEKYIAIQREQMRAEREGGIAVPTI